MFAIRAALAATMSPTWGVYSGFELYEREPVAPGQRGVPELREVRAAPARLRRRAERGPLAGAVDDPAQRDPPRAPGAAAAARHRTSTTRDNDQLIAYSKTGPAAATPCWWSCTLDPHERPDGQPRRSTCRRWASDWSDTLIVHDEVSGETFDWGQFNFVAARAVAGRRAHP